MPKIEQPVPAHLQIANYFKDQIITGVLMSGSKLPSVRAIAAEFGMSQGVAQRAISYLQDVERLVYTVPGKGTYVDGHRAKYGPQQRIRSAAFPMAERVEVRAAELAEAPGNIVLILGLHPGADGVPRVIRREWVTYEDGDVPFMLSVAWCAPEAAAVVPELLDLLPLDSGAAAKLIAERTGQGSLRGHSGREARQIIDDGREGPLLRLPRDARVYAEVYTWTSGEDVLEYGEFILLEGRVIESEMEL